MKLSSIKLSGLKSSVVLSLSFKLAQIVGFIKIRRLLQSPSMEVQNACGVRERQRFIEQ